jgi:hypothetical protein
MNAKLHPLTVLDNELDDRGARDLSALREARAAVAELVAAVREAVTPTFNTRDMERAHARVIAALAPFNHE